MYFFPSGFSLTTVCMLTTSAAFAASVQAAQPPASETPRAIVESASHDFGRAEQGARLVHQFTIRNTGTSPLTVTRLALSAPGMTAKVKPTILPGQEETLTVEWDTAGAKGTVEGKAVLDVNDPASPQLAFFLTAVVKEAVEFLPYQAVFTSVFQGEPGRRSVRVVNNRELPLAITRLEQQGEHFQSSIKQVESGRVYELEVTVPETVPPGRYSEAVFLYADNPKLPRYMVPVNIIVKADLSVNADVVDFGRVSLTELARNPSSFDLLRETLIVRKRAGKFSIKAVTSDIGCVNIQRSPDANTSSDAFRIDVALEKDGLRPGLIDGRIRIRTDDERFPELVVSVRGVIE
jgi:Protein of unknown function (DUF1573)